MIFDQVNFFCYIRLYARYNKQDQVSLVICYTIINFEKKEIEIKESFLGLYLLTHHGAANYVDLLQNTLLNLNLNIKKCRGQGYDGAAVMSGSIKVFKNESVILCQMLPLFIAVPII